MPVEGYMEESALSILWVPRMEFRLSDLAAGTFTR